MGRARAVNFYGTAGTRRTRRARRPRPVFHGRTVASRPHTHVYGGDRRRDTARRRRLLRSGGQRSCAVCRASACLVRSCRSRVSCSRRACLSPRHPPRCSLRSGTPPRQSHGTRPRARPVRPPDDDAADGGHHHGGRGLPGVPGVRGLFQRRRRRRRHRVARLLGRRGRRGRRPSARRRQDVSPPPSPAARLPVLAADGRLRTVHEQAVHEDFRQREGHHQRTDQTAVLQRLDHPSLFQIQVMINRVICYRLRGVLANHDRSQAPSGSVSLTPFS